MRAAVLAPLPPPHEEHHPRHSPPPRTPRIGHGAPSGRVTTAASPRRLLIGCGAAPSAASGGGARAGAGPERGRGVEPAPGVVKLEGSERGSGATRDRVWAEGASRAVPEPRGTEDLVLGPTPFLDPLFPYDVRRKGLAGRKPVPGSWFLFPRNLGARYLRLQRRWWVFFLTFPSTGSAPCEARPRPIQAGGMPAGASEPRARKGGGAWYQAAHRAQPSQASSSLSFPVRGAEDCGA